MKLATAPPTRRRMPAADRRKLILAEATMIIGERGFRAFSLNELARRCGLTNAGLLHHFASKELLLVALLERRDLDDQHAIEAQVRARSGSRRAVLPDLVAALRAIMIRNVHRPELVRLSIVLSAEALMHDHPAHAFFRDREARTIAALESVMAGLVRHPTITARQVTAVMSGLETQWLRADHAFDLVAVWDAMAADMILPLSSGDMR